MKTTKLTFLLSGLVILLIIAGCTPQPVPDVTNQWYVSPTPVPDMFNQWYVSPTGSDANDCHTLNTPCQHIAVALERAAENDFIHLSAGTFNENLVIKKSITILGEGRDQTFLDGVTGTVIEIGDGEGLSEVPDVNMDGPSPLNVTLSWFTIEKGNATDINNISIGFGGGLYITDGTVNLNGISLFQNKANVGAGMYSCNYCTVIANDLIVRGNESVGPYEDNTAGGIANEGEMSLVDSLIEMNVTERLGGGIFNGWHGNLILERVQLIHNLAGIAGGGIINLHGDATLTDVDFQSNEAAYGGGMLNLGYMSTVLIQRSDFLSNRATNFGGAIANMDGVHLTMVNVTLSSNQALHGAGIANGTPEEDFIYSAGDDVFVTAVVNAYNLTFAYNQALIGGGVYNLENGKINILNSLFVDNTAGSCIGSVTGDGNMSTDATCAFDGLNNFYDFNPLIESVPDQNGGITFSHALQPNSPAIDAGINGPRIPTEDQRGYPRPTNGDGFGESRNDIGAYEADEVEATYTISQPDYTPNNNANCRQGPGLVYGVSTFGTAGTSYPIQGISRDGFWYYIQYNESLRCWMSGDTGETSGDLGELPVIEAPPVAVERPGVVCTNITTYSDCASHSECQWIPLSDLLGYCTNK